MIKILKYLLSEGGYISAAMTIGSMIANGVMGAKKSKAAKKLTHKTGEEANLQGFIDNNLLARQISNEDWLNKSQDAAESGGLFPAISEAFSQRPNSAEYDAIANQERNLKNQALNTGARGGLLKQQMFEAAKNAASNKLNVMENARQNALQRGFQAFMPTQPTQAVNTANTQQQLAGLSLLSNLGVERNKMGLGLASSDAAGAGSGLGSILGGLNLGSIFGGSGGGITSAVGGTPSFSLPGAGQGFSQIPFMSGFGGG